MKTWIQQLSEQYVSRLNEQRLNEVAPLAAPLVSAGAGLARIFLPLLARGGSAASRGVSAVLRTAGSNTLAGAATRGAARGAARGAMSPKEKEDESTTTGAMKGATTGAMKGAIQGIIKNILR